MQEMFAGIRFDSFDNDHNSNERPVLRGMKLSDDPFMTPWDLPAKKKPRKYVKKIVKKL
jgi:hypothetical protein